MQYIFSFVHIYVNTCVSGYLSYPYDVVPIRAGFAVCCTWVKQRNSGLDAWESTQLQTTDLGTASCLRYFRQSIGSREHPDQTVVLGFLRFPADDPRNQFWKTEGLTLPKLGMEARDQFLSKVFNVSLICVSKKDPYLELERISGAAEVGEVNQVLQSFLLGLHADKPKQVTRSHFTVASITFRPLRACLERVFGGGPAASKR